MPEILTESFCERCGTRYTFEPVTRPKGRLGRLRVIGRGLRNYVLSDETTLDEAFADARSEEDRELSTQQLDAFHQAFNFCMSCRQYTCANCWNEPEGKCLTCAPHLGRDVLAAPFPDFGPADAGTTAAASPAGGGPDAAPLITASAWPTVDLAAAAPEPVAEAAPAAGGERPAEPSLAARLELLLGAVPAGPEAAAAEAGPAPVEPSLPAADAAAVTSQAAPAVAEPAASEPVAAAVAPELAPAEPVAAEAGPTGTIAEPPPTPEIWPAVPTGTIEAAPVEPAPVEPAPAEAPRAEQAAAAARQTRDLLARFRPGGEAAAPPAPAVGPSAPPPVAARPTPRPALPDGWRVTAPEAAELAAAQPVETAEGKAPVAPAAVPTTPTRGTQPPPAAPPASLEAPWPMPPAPAAWPLAATPPRPAPQAWPTDAPQWPPAPASSSGGTSWPPAPAAAATSSGPAARVWAASARDVLDRAGSVQACVSCGLPLSARARFCRRCGSRQN